MKPVCDHKSVGMFVWNEDKLLLIERARFPFGLALPAGHVDQDKTFEDAARRELKEEVDLDTKEMELVAEGRKENPCRRDGGTWHYWKLYKSTTVGSTHGSPDEVKQLKWYTRDELKKLAEQTKKYVSGEISEEEWEKQPGLEPVMYEWFKELSII